MTHAAWQLLEAASHALRGDDERKRDVAPLLLAAFPTEEAALPLLCRAVSLEVSATAEEGGLWRGGSLAVYIVNEFARQMTVGKGLLGQALSGHVRALCKRPASVEVEPARLALELGCQLAPPTFYTSTSPTPDRRAPSRSPGSASPRIPRSASGDMHPARSVDSATSQNEHEGEEEEKELVEDELRLRAQREEDYKRAREAQQAYFWDIAAPNRHKLQAITLDFLHAIDAAMRACSSALRALLRHMFNAVAQRFPGSEFKAVGALICLRLFCPAIVAPEAYNLAKSVTPKAKRSLVLVAKLLQTLVNEAPFEKEMCMLPFDNFIRDHIPVVHSMFLAWMAEESRPSSPRSAPVPLAGHLRLKEMRRRLGTALGGHCEQELAAFLAHLSAVDAKEIHPEPLSSSPSTSASSSSSQAASIDCHKKGLGSSPGPCKEEVLRWTAEEVVRWLERSDYSKETVEALRKADIDGKCIMRLSTRVLMTVGVMNLGERKKLIKAIDQISTTYLWSWVNQEVEQWPVSGVAMWLRLHGLHEYADLFIDRDVSGKVLLKLTQHRLLEMGVNKFGHIKRILRMIRELSLSPQERLQAKRHAKLWTLGDVCDWLRMIELQQHFHLFYSDEVDGPKILQLTDSKLAEMGVDALGHRKRIMKHVRQHNTQ